MWRAPSIILALVLASCATTPRESSDPIAAYGAMLTADARSARIVVLDKDGRAIVARGFGDRGDGKPPDAESLYPVGSISKLFTATTIVKLADEGKLDLDDPLVKHVPELELRAPLGGGHTAPWSTSDITLRHLLTHSAGLPSDIYHRLLGEHALDKDALFDWRELPKLLSRHHAVDPVGEVNGYTNIGFALLGLVVERAGGATFAEQVRASIASPAGLSRSTFAPGPADESARALVADEPYRALAVIPAGGLWSTADEVARFGHAVMRGDVVKDPARLWAVQSARPLDVGYRQGLGWYHYDGPRAAGLVVGHNGSTPQTRATLLVAPERGVVVAVTAAGGADTARVAQEVLAHTLDIPLKFPNPERVPLTPFGGWWQAGDFGVIKARVSGETLRTQFAGFDVELGPALARDGRFEGLTPRAKFGPLRLAPSAFKSLRYSFEAVGNTHVLVSYRGGTKALAGFRVPPTQITRAWRERFGTWRIANEQNPIFESFTLLEDDARLIWEGTFFGGASTVRYALEVVDDRHARVVGHGRDLGFILRAEDDGRLFFSGYDLGPDEQRTPDGTQ